MHASSAIRANHKWVVLLLLMILLTAISASGDAQAFAPAHFGPPITVTVTGPGTVAEGDAGTTTFTFTIDLSMAAPSDITLDYQTMNGTATTGDGDYTASGLVSVTIPMGSTMTTFDIDVIGDSKFEADETFDVEFSNLVGGVFSGGMATETVTATIQNDDAAPTVDVDNPTFTEGVDNKGQFTLTLSGNTDFALDISVFFTITPGTATSPDDFSIITASPVVFPAGNTNSRRIRFDIIDNAIAEPDENFTVTLGPITNGQVGASPGVATIEDDDVAKFSIDDRSLNEGDAGTVDMNFTVKLSRDVEETVTIDVSTADDTATAPADYVEIPAGTPQTVTFNPGDPLEQIVTVTINGDGIDEGDSERFFINLSNPTGVAEIKDGQGIGIIRDDDEAIVNIIAFNDSNDIEVFEEGETSDTYAVTLGSAPSADVIINIRPDTQTTVAPRQLTFTNANWNMPQQVTVTAVDDALVEGTHTSNLNHNLSSGDPGFDGLFVDVEAKVFDNDFAPPPIAPLCNDLDGSTNQIVRATIPENSVTGGDVYCRVLAEFDITIEEAAAIGIQGLVDRDVTYAVDVFGLFDNGTSATVFNNPVQVCLRGTGVFHFLSALDAPRVPRQIGSELVGINGTAFSCATITQAGTVVMTRS
ncbi:MAG: hypothetical protein D6737_05885 [Chloroflexi bacterium]|nr:MAG: hypothetical protein D6737_05885 [Chloroflexota bacterium]